VSRVFRNPNTVRGVVMNHIFHVCASQNDALAQRD
jgi:hypothetical protein